MSQQLTDIFVVIGTTLMALQLMQTWQKKES